MQHNKIRLSAVSYLNTKPFIYGLFRGELAEEIELNLDIPSECARKLKAGEVDLALTPVAIIPELPQAWVVSDFCIGSTGTVKTVCLFSEKPLEEIKTILLDFHSRTSVALTRILCEQYWHIQPELVHATEGFEKSISGDTAALIIGDRTIGLHKRYSFIYDLGEAWTSWTGLPFVYAAWVSTRPLDSTMLARFNQALAGGLDHLPELIKILPTIPGFNLDEYYRENISYDLDESKWIALNRFLKILSPEKDYHLERQSVVAPTI